ncbi:hypothetical protein BX600DRAFT_460943 [Xylariales sp. PMI_506]|nr:hypothetical protein BX600DRAFT_460943 [Xylariales sp. PMI_506]
MTSLLDGRNVSYYTIPAAMVIALLPRVYSGIAGPGKKYFDKSNPRSFSAKLDKIEALDKQLRLRLQRAEACCANGFEGLPLFAASVTAGNAAGVPTDTLNFLSVGYLAIRLVYSWIYVFVQDDPKFARVRTPIWTLGTACIMTLFVKAGLKSQP